ncbi:MAG: hypothetical protein JWM11_6263 [Planctomycetaceae bacterium]|nr:hypothetical protein [Planctomycetaceae bacterium]
MPSAIFIHCHLVIGNSNTVRGGTAADLVGLRSIVGGVTGEDPFTLEPWSDGYRLFQAVSGTAQLISTAFGISSAISFCVSPCRSLHWGSCFVGETQVLTREIEAATTSAVVAAEDSSPDTFELLAPVCLLLGAAGAMLLQRKRQSRGNSKRSAAVLDRCDELFADPHYKLFWDSLDPDSIQTADSDAAAFAPESRETVTAVADSSRGISSVNSIKVSAIMEIKPQSTLLTASKQRPSPQFQPWKDPHSIQESTDPTERWRPTTIAWLLMCLILCGFCFLQARPTSWATPTIAKESTHSQPVIRKFESNAIQDITTGMRVIAENPELKGQFLPDTNIDPETWRNVKFRMNKPDGGDLLITLLRSLDWLKEHKAQAGGEIRLTFPELGIDGQASVIAIESCPPIEAGHGRVVTGTFRHSAANVIDLYVSSEDKPIGTTSNHPFWSETRQKFVKAGTLQNGEQLRNANGITALVTRIIARTKHASVYNLEINAEHAYAVASNGLIVHNSGDDYANIAPRTATEAAEHGLTIRNENWPWRGMHEIEGHHPLMQGSSYRQFWKDRGFTNAEVEGFIVDLDVDVHQAFTNSGWWDNQLFNNINEAESALKGTRLLNKDEVLGIVNGLLGEVAAWSP